jgi:hypothetical protein
MEVFVGGALMIDWVIFFLWAMAKTATRALRGDQFNSELATGRYSLVYQKFVVLARYRRRGLCVCSNR